MQALDDPDSAHSSEEEDSLSDSAHVNCKKCRPKEKAWTCGTGDKCKGKTFVRIASHLRRFHHLKTGTPAYDEARKKCTGKLRTALAGKNTADPLPERGPDLSPDSTLDVYLDAYLFD